MATIRIYNAYKDLGYKNAKDLIDDLIEIGYTDLTHNSTAKKFTPEMEKALKDKGKIPKNVTAFSGVQEKKEKRKVSKRIHKKPKKPEKKGKIEVYEEDDEEFEEVFVGKYAVTKKEEESEKETDKEDEVVEKVEVKEENIEVKREEEAKERVLEDKKEKFKEDIVKREKGNVNENSPAMTVDRKTERLEKIHMAAKRYNYSPSSFKRILEKLGFTGISYNSFFTKEMEEKFVEYIEKEKEILRKREEAKRATFNLPSPKKATVEVEEKKKEKKKKKKKKKKFKKIDEKVLEENIKKTLQQMQQKKKRKKYKKDTGGEEIGEEESVIQIPEFISVGELADMMDVDVTDIIKIALELGLNVTINQRIDYDTAELLASEFGYKVELLPEYKMEETLLSEYEEIEEIDESKVQKIRRAPVVTVMGHVDHGKTSILDYIRNTRVAEKEAGGITQSLGAYKVFTENGDIVFLDTPGHEAFTAMRARGAQVTDIVVLVVAANDGVMPQTVEAINHAKAAGVPIIVAINKMDLPGVNAEIIKSQLVKHGLLVEEYGGDVIAIPVSAKTGMGINDLLEAILITAEDLDLEVPVNTPARGTVLEAELNKKIGNVISLLVQEGTLHVGDTFFVGRTYGRVRAMYDEWGKRIKEAGPSTPVLVQGMNELPEVGDKLYVVSDEKKAKEIARKRTAAYKEQQMRKKELTLESLSKQFLAMERKSLNLIIKGDKAGSVEAISDELQKYSTEKVAVNIVHRTTGVISENDVMLASASEAIIIGFNVQVDSKARQLANQEKVEIRTYKVIYDIIEDVVKALEGMLEPKWEEEKRGEAEVRQVFNLPKGIKVAGCYVVEGVIHRSHFVKIIRDGEEIYNGKLSSLKRFKDDVKQVESGYECGMTFENFNDIKEGDRVISYEKVEKRPSLHGDD